MAVKIVQSDQELEGAAFDAMARYVAEHYAEHVTAADIARAATISRTRAYEIFRERAGTSPADYLIEHRMMRAEELLADTDLPMAEVARRCGFSSPSHLAKTLRDRCGQTPTEARKRLRRRKAHLTSGPLAGVANGLSMQMLGMSYQQEG